MLSEVWSVWGFMEFMPENGEAYPPSKRALRIGHVVSTTYQPQAGGDDDHPGDHAAERWSPAPAFGDKYQFRCSST